MNRQESASSIHSSPSGSGPNTSMSNSINSMSSPHIHGFRGPGQGHGQSPGQGHPPRFLSRPQPICDDQADAQGQQEGRCPSWSELKATVREARRSFSTPTCCSALRTPSSFTFRRFEDKTRVYFLSAMSAGKESTLLYVDIVDGEDRTSLHWEPLLEASFSVVPVNGSKQSKEEQLLSERKRCINWGLTQYEFHKESGKFVFPAAGSVFGCVDYGKGPRFAYQGVVFPYEIKSRSPASRLNPICCPTNPDLVVYVVSGDIWVTNATTGQEVQLTFCHVNSDSLADDPLMAGLPSYVTQEEFNRFIGYWWRPTSSDGRYNLLYEEVDESKVQLLKFPQPASNEVEEFRFPRAGTANAKSTLKMVSFTLGGANGEDICDVQPMELRTPLEEQFQWAEYLVRAGWLPDGENAWVQLLNRRQQTMQLIMVPFRAFVPAHKVTPVRGQGQAQVDLNSIQDELGSPGPRASGNSSEEGGSPNSLSRKKKSRTSSPASHSAPEEARAPPVKYQVLYQIDAPDSWVAVNDVLLFLDEECPSIPGTDLKEVKFIIASEETGFRHLYYVTTHVRDSLSEPIRGEDDDSMSEYVTKKVALTHGNWSVLDKQIWYDKEKKFVYFHGLKCTPLEKHLYVVSLDHPTVIGRLTEPGYSHSAALNEDCSMFVSVFSSIDHAPTCRVFRIGYKPSVTLTSTSATSEPTAPLHSKSAIHNIDLYLAGWLLEPKPLDKDYGVPELFSHTIGSGDLLYGMVFKPPKMDLSKKYPVVLSVYGGPEVQLVTNSFEGMGQMRNHLLASQGYIVISIDSRGSQNRGMAFEAHLKNRMGQVELGDQVEMLTWLGRHNRFMDMDRVAIHGWSYGGYLALMGLVQYPHVFKVSVAGAPVTTWLHYDTGYTERYMDLPNLNMEGYKLGSVLHKAQHFPDEPNRLLIVHGLLDENVHFTHHTSRLISQLIRYGKPYQLQVYPSERHSLRHLDSIEHFETALLSFLISNL